MLTELRVSNFALIEQLHLTIPSGFVALTGETGAGKSLLVDAIALLLGQRATNDQIRTGAEEAELEAAFSLSSSSPLLTQLRAADVLRADESDLIVRRVLSRSGRGRSYLNGRMVSLHELEQFAGLLVDIHGQHEQQSLLSPAAQLEALDSFGRLGELRASYAETHARWSEAQAALAQATAQATMLRAREDLLRFQAQEILEAGILPGEDGQLIDQVQRLGHAERLRGLAEQAYAVLYGGEGAIVEQLGAVAQQVKALAGIDREAESWCQEIAQASVLLQEVTGHLRHYRESLLDDPSRLAELETRLARLDALKKKYGGSLEAVSAKGAELSAQVASLDQGDAELTRLSEIAAQRHREMQVLADALSAKRRRVTAKFEQALMKEFGALHLAGARLEVRIEPLAGPATYGPMGQDRVQFLFSANKGEPLQPLARVASGGESSRVMLALKTVLAAHDTVPVLIFDEIDSGVGGAVAKAVGQRLRGLSEYHQVLCVTHLPQVASQAQAQIQVQKHTQEQRTVTFATRLDRGGREEEIAKMLGGHTVSPAMRRAAVELLTEADRSN